MDTNPSKVKLVHFEARTHIVSGVEGGLSAGKTPYDLTCRDEREHGGH